MKMASSKRQLGALRILTVFRGFIGVFVAGGAAEPRIQARHGGALHRLRHVGVLLDLSLIHI